MKLTKIFIPMLAMVFAIGMAFATEKTNADTATEDYATKYVLVDSTWHTIEVEECIPGSEQCMVIFSEDPTATPYGVYNSRSLNDPTAGSGQAVLIEGPVPSN